jgi:hypothetical protein
MVNSLYNACEVTLRRDQAPKHPDFALASLGFSSLAGSPEPLGVCAVIDGHKKPTKGPTDTGRRDAYHAYGSSIAVRSLQRRARVSRSSADLRDCPAIVRVQINFMHISSDRYTALETAAAPGAVHDSSMAYESELARSMLSQNALNRALRHGLFVVGDSAYKLSPFLLKAYSINPRHAGASLVEQHVFNLIVTRVRQKAEHINAHIDSRWKAWDIDGRYCEADWNTRTGKLAVWLHNFAITWQAEHAPAQWQLEQKARVAALARDHPSGLPTCVLPAVDYERALRDDAYCHDAGVRMRDAFARHWTSLMGDQVLILSTGASMHAMWRAAAGRVGMSAPSARVLRSSEEYIGGTWICDPTGLAAAHATDVATFNALVHADQAAAAREAARLDALAAESSARDASQMPSFDRMIRAARATRPDGAASASSVTQENSAATAT